MPETKTAFYLPPPNVDHRPEDVVTVVAYYAEQAGVEPTVADFARAGYWAALGRTNDFRVLNGMCPVGMEATWSRTRDA